MTIQPVDDKTFLGVISALIFAFVILWSTSVFIKDKIVGKTFFYSITISYSGIFLAIVSSCFFVAKEISIPIIFHLVAVLMEIYFLIWAYRKNLLNNRETTK